MENGEAAFDDVAEVANGWVFDFMFASMCHYFKEERAEDFQRTCKAIEVLLEGMPVLDHGRNKAVFIAQFLTRVAEGKQLDSQFELEEKLTPLESAVLVLEQIEEKEEHLINLLNDIKCFVKVQTVTICMEKGKFKQSTEILDRQFQETESNKYLKMKLAMIINKKDPYHEFLQHFSYAKMLTKIKSYIDHVLKERPSFLLKVASKVIMAKSDRPMETPSGKGDGSFITNERLTESGVSFSTEDPMASDPEVQPSDSTPKKVESENASCETEQVDTSDTSDHNLNQKLKPVTNREEVTSNPDKSTGRQHKRLFSLEPRTPWNPDKPCDQKKQICHLKQRKRSQKFEKSVKAKLPSNSAAHKRKQPWTWEEDELLKRGVRKYGVGNWSKILVHFEFDSRTGVMLKDRWRTMKRLNIVGSDEET